jgi:hypothetical protein
MPPKSTGTIRENWRQPPGSSSTQNDFADQDAASARACNLHDGINRFSHFGFQFGIPSQSSRQWAHLMLQACVPTR